MQKALLLLKGLSCKAFQIPTDYSGGCRCTEKDVFHWPVYILSTNLVGHSCSVEPQTDDCFVMHPWFPNNGAQHKYLGPNLQNIL